MSFKVLVVDDDKPSLELIKECLLSLGVNVRSCDDSEDAARRIGLERFDAIFMDLMMPRLDGFRLARLVRQSSWNKNCPIVIISGNSEGTAMKESFVAGGSFFLRKPIDRRRLQMLLQATHAPILGNQRGFIRVPLTVDVKCQAGLTAPSKCSAVNVSERGVLLSVQSELNVGQSVNLRFRLPDQDAEIATAGVVTRIDRAAARTGISFTQIRSTDRQRIRLYVSDCVSANTASSNAEEKSRLRHRA
jgi:CheY-like chemotaxis protein